MDAKIAIIGVLCCLGMVGHADFEDQQNADIEYCSNVKTGTWANYKNFSEVYCKKVLDEKI